MRILAPLLISAVVTAMPAWAQTIERIKETKQLKIGYRVDAPPLSYAASDGQPAGYSPLICVGLAQVIANRLEMADLEVLFEPVDTKDRFEKVASGEIDLLCGASTITLERRAMVDFSVPTFVDGAAVLLPKGAGSGIADLAGKKVGVRSSTTTERALETSLKAANVDANTELFSDHDAGIDALKNGEISAYFADQSILMYNFFSQNMKEDFLFPEQLLTLEKQGLALAKGDSDFRLLIDAGLAEMFAKGTIQKHFSEAFPGAKPGQGTQAMYLLSPTLP
ncbi:MAG: amino acid ABC transporter substrate-binding protein [Paracoccaceae bacterium]